MFLASLLLTLKIFTPYSSVSVVNFEHVVAGWGYTFRAKKTQSLLIAIDVEQQALIQPNCKH